MNAKITFLLFSLLSFAETTNSYGQQKDQINWISFTQLSDSLKVHPKKVFVNFYAYWCVYCKEMDRTTFQNK